MLVSRSMLAVVLLLLPASLSAQNSTNARDHSILVGGRTRSYLVDLPVNYDQNHRYPVVLNFHGGGGSPNGARTQSGLSTLTTQVGAIAVYPAGTGRFSNERLLTWNTESCCGYAKREHIDEAAFVRALLDTLEATYAVDPTRVYAIGLSNGGMMAHLVGCRLSDRIAAIAVVSGELTVDCRATRPVSVLIIHGTGDENLPYTGGVGKKALDPHEVRPVSYAVDTWRALDHCTGSPTISVSGAVTHRAWASCADGSGVELYTIDGGGHAWPGGQRMSRVLDAPSGALDATKVAWAFFEAHPRR